MRTRVYILAGGLGTRLSHIVKDVPKPMAPVAGKPFLEWQIEWLKRQSFCDIVLLVGHMSGLIESYFGDGTKFGVSIEYSYEKELLGTGGAVIRALHDKKSDVFIVMNGDTYFNADIRTLASSVSMPDNNDLVTIALKYKDDVRRYGAVSIDDNFYVTEFIEKSDSAGGGYINGGIYVGQSRIFSNYPEKRVSMETDLFPELLKQNRIKGIPSEGNFIDIGVPEDYYLANRVIGEWSAE